MESFYSIIDFIIAVQRFDVSFFRYYQMPFNGILFYTQEEDSIMEKKRYVVVGNR